MPRFVLGRVLNTPCPFLVAQSLPPQSQVLLQLLLLQLVAKSLHVRDWDQSYNIHVFYSRFSLACQSDGTGRWVLGAPKRKEVSRSYTVTDIPRDKKASNY